MSSRGYLHAHTHIPHHIKASACSKIRHPLVFQSYLTSIYTHMSVDVGVTLCRVFVTTDNTVLLAT